MKKIISIFFVALFLLGSLGISSFACEFSDTCTAGDPDFGCPSGCAMCNIFFCREGNCRCKTVDSAQKAAYDGIWNTIISPIRDMIIILWTNIFGSAPGGAEVGAPLNLPYGLIEAE